MMYCVFYWLMRAVFGLWFRLKVRGMEQVPRKGAAIVVANHRSGFDPPLMGALLPRPVYFMAKAELFRFPPFAWLISALHAYPVDRSRADRAALRRSLQLLRDGQALLIFPEGHRSPDGRLQPMRGGVLVMAQMTGAPIIPVAIAGRYSFRGKIAVSVGAPFTIGREADQEEARRRLYDAIAGELTRAQAWLG
jgi:1-acyl-sn-glycerol-3-phosphate acyltransferase